MRVKVMEQDELMGQDKLDVSFTAFEALIDEEFSIQSDERLMRFKLVEVARLPPATTRTDIAVRQDPFALLFKEMTDFQPDQKTYIARTATGTVELFLVPVGFGEYEAIFN